MYFLFNMTDVTVVYIITVFKMIYNTFNNLSKPAPFCKSI